MSEQVAGQDETPDPDPGAAQGRGVTRSLRAPVLGVVGILATVAVWELAVRVDLLSERDVAAPAAVVGAFAELVQQEAFWSDVWTTVRAAALGLGVGTVVGVVVGALMGANRFVDAALRPTVEFMRPVPSIALIPLMVLMWGQTTRTVWVIVAFGCAWPMLIQTIYAVRAIGALTLDTARVFHIRGWSFLRHVVLPAMAPYLMTGLRITASLSLMVAVSVQIIVGAPGLGQAIMFEQRSLDLPAMYALIAVTGVLGILVNLVFGRLESRFLQWHVTRGKEAA